MRTMCSRKQVEVRVRRDAYNINHSNCIHKNNNNKCIHDRNEIVDICDLRACHTKQRNNTSIAQWTSNIELFLFIQMNNKLLSIGLWILTAVFCVLLPLLLLFFVPGLNLYIFGLFIMEPPLVTLPVIFIDEERSKTQKKCTIFWTNIIENQSQCVMCDGFWRITKK